MANEKINVKFLIAYHKPDILFDNEMLIPIHVGRALLRKRAATDETAKKNLLFLERAMIGDDTGDNISDKNGCYNELTALYWAWKNYDQIGNPTHIGLMHYRRHFIFKDLPNTFNECNNAGANYLSRDLNFDRKTIEGILRQYEFIAKKPAKFERVYDAYLANHRPENMAEAIAILKERFPEYAESCDRYMNGTDCYYLNMFVFPKDIFFRYCEYMFGILGEFEKRMDTSRMRFFISEFLTGIFIQHLIDTGHKGAFYPTMYLEEQATVPVVYCATEENIRRICVSVSSVLRNLKPNTVCALCVVCRQEEAEFVRQHIDRIAANYPNCRAQYLVAAAFENREINADAMLLYAVRELEYGKAIFLTSDTVCKGDLTAFFRNSVDDYAIAGARSSKVLAGTEVCDGQLKNFGLKDTVHYIDSGVMLVNLNRLKQFDLVNTLVQRFCATQFSIEELLNAVCYDQIRTMPLRQNMAVSYYEDVAGVTVPKEYLTKNYPIKDMQRAMQTALIIQYDSAKPWQDAACFRAGDWFFHEEKSAFDSDLIVGKVSVIIPVYNAEKYIGQALASLLKQTYAKFEVICVNDGSTDGTADILEKFAKKDRRIKIIAQENRGAAAARNCGIALADGQYTAILDADDVYLPEMLQTLVKKAEETSAEIVLCKSVGFNTEDDSEIPMAWSLLTDKIPRNPFTYKDMGPYLYNFTKGWAWDKLFSTKLLRRARLQFQELQNTNDAFFVYSMLTRAQAMAYTEKVLVRHRKNDASSISNNRVKNWYCFYQAIAAIKKNLLDTGVYAKVERAFVNWVLNFTLWYVRSEPYPLKNYLYILLKGAIFDEFGINNRTADYFINREDYELYLSVQSIPIPAETRERLNDFYVQKEKFEISSVSDLVQIDKAGIEIKRARRGLPAERPVVPVALSCNENYAKYTAVTIQSLIENAGPANRYEIYVLHTELKPETMKRLEKIRGVNYSVRCINVEKFLPPAGELFVNEHITKETYYRFCIPEAIVRPKVIYIDCDLVVLADIAELYSQPTNGAAISGINNFMNRGMYLYVKDSLKIDPAAYINGGVLLIDTKRYKEEKIKEKFVRLVKNEYRFLDQDIINVICEGKITLLPDRWNYQWHNANEKRPLMAKQAEYNAIAKDPAILHFTTRHKAWNTPNWALAERFWYYAAHTEFFAEILSVNAEAVKTASYDVRRVPYWKSGAIQGLDSAAGTEFRLRQVQAVYEDEIERLAKQLSRAKSDADSLRNSLSFKVGRMITWAPRSVRRGWRCFRKNGLRYTLVRLFRGREGAIEYKNKRRARKIRG